MKVTGLIFERNKSCPVELKTSGWLYRLWKEKETEEIKGLKEVSINAEQI